MNMLDLYCLKKCSVLTMVSSLIFPVDNDYRYLFTGKFSFWKAGILLKTVDYYHVLLNI